MVIARDSVRTVRQGPSRGSTGHPPRQPPRHHVAAEVVGTEQMAVAGRGVRLRERGGSGVGETDGGSEMRPDQGDGSTTTAAIAIGAMSARLLIPRGSTVRASDGRRRSRHGHDRTDARRATRSAVA